MGRAVGSNFSKLFFSILHNRISIFCEQNHIIRPYQIGYKKKTRTSDHILTLKNIIDKYIRKVQRSYLFACFVDFTLAFGTVWRCALIYQLFKNGIGGNLLLVIESMYNNVSYCVNISNNITRPIPSNVGVKQVCLL
jgi:hypothetical protein